MAPHSLSCPKCEKLATRGSLKTWQIVVAVCLFPIGLLVLLMDRKPTECPNCKFTWQA
jgi:hypothetical protein